MSVKGDSHLEMQLGSKINLFKNRKLEFEFSFKVTVTPPAISSAKYMNNIFLIFGYGVPKDIFKDENYNFYLKMAFNKIYDITTKNKISNPIIICSGGMTDCFRPYKRSEAGEMVTFLKEFCKKPFLKKITKNWTFIAENRSLSTLENLLNSLEIVKKKNIKDANFYIFYEKTREKRVKTMAKKILKNYKFEVFPIDFDVSQNRYLDPEFLKNKEKTELKHSLWALKSPENLKKHHKMFLEKIEYFRREQVDKNPDVIRKWWESKMENIHFPKK